MPRFKSTLTPEERAPQAAIVPDRVQRILNLYAKNHIEYNWTQEDRGEQNFEYWRQKHKDSYKYSIIRIDRVRDARGTEEFYFYQMKQSALNDNGVRENSRELTYGFAVERYCEEQYNPRTNQKEMIFVRDIPTYFFKWDKDEVRALLKGSEEPCKNFCLGDMGEKGQNESSASRNIYALGHRNAEEDFIEGNFDDLILIASSSFKGPGSALHLVAKIKDDQEKAVLVKMREQQQKKT